MKQIKLTGVIGSILLIIKYIIAAIFSINSISGKVYFLFDNILSTLGFISILYSFRLVLRMYSYKKYVLLINALIKILIFMFIYRIVLIFVNPTFFSLLSFLKFISSLIVIFLSIRLLLIKNDNFQNLSKLKLFIKIYLSTSIIWLILLIFKLQGIILYSVNVTLIVFIIPFVFSLILFVKTPFESSVENKIIK